MGYDVQQLLTYSQGIYSDWAIKHPITKFFAPEVPVMAEKFFYKNFGTGNQFNLQETTRAIGGGAARLAFQVTDSQSVLFENSLETTIDDIEKRQNAEMFDQLQMVKIRDLSTTILNNDLKALFAFMNGTVAVTPSGGAIPAPFSGGLWSTSVNDPIVDIDAVCKYIADLTGLIPNRIYLDLGAWLLAKNNTKILGRIQYIQFAIATIEQIKALTAVPLEWMIGGGAQFVSGSASNCWIFYGQDNPGQMDPSAFKTFVRTANRFDALRQYREERIRSDVYYIDWQQNRLVTGPSLVVRFTVT